MIIWFGWWPISGGSTTSPCRVCRRSRLVVRGSTRLAHRWLEEVPVSLAFSERYFIQMDPDLAEPRVSIWGMDNASTQIAVSVFVDRFLGRFLERCATVPAHLSTVDSDGETGVDTSGDDDDDDD